MRFHHLLRSRDGSRTQNWAGDPWPRCPPAPVYRWTYSQRTPLSWFPGSLFEIKSINLWSLIHFIYLVSTDNIIGSKTLGNKVFCIAGSISSYTLLDLVPSLRRHLNKRVIGLMLKRQQLLFVYIKSFTTSKKQEFGLKTVMQRERKLLLYKFSKDRKWAQQCSAIKGFKITAHLFNKKVLS